jgi:hypothetical protein
MRSHGLLKAVVFLRAGEDTEETREHRGLILPLRRSDHGVPESEKFYDFPKLRVLCVSVVIHSLFFLGSP